jgi:alpha-glucuronidase
MKIKNLILLIILLTIAAVYSSPVKSQSLKENPALDGKVRKFLAENLRQRYDMNVPSVDRQLF